MGFKTLPVRLGQFSIQKRRHAIRHCLAGVRFHKNAQAEMLHEIAHRAVAAGGQDMPAGVRCRGECRSLRMEARRVGGNNKVGRLEIALAFFVRHEFLADQNSLRESEIIGEQLVVFERAVTVV